MTHALTLPQYMQAPDPDDPARYQECRYRYGLPIWSLISTPGDKSLYAGIVAALSKTAEVFIETAAVDPILVSALIIAIVADFITGRTAAEQRGEPVTSWGYRQTFIKALEYAAFILLFAAIDNAFFDTGILEYGAAGWVLRTEAKSVTENVFNDGRSADIKEWIDEVFPTGGSND